MHENQGFLNNLRLKCGIMLGFYPGSFDPITRGHLDIIRRGLAFCPQLVIGVGQNVSKQTLFTAEERVRLVQQALQEALPAELVERVAVEAFSGATVNHAAAIGARVILKGLRGAVDYSFEEKMAIVNQRLAPEIESVFLFTDNALRDVSSSVVKEMALSGIAREKFDHYLTPLVRDALLQRLAS